MKFKSMIAVAISSMLAASFVYAAPSVKLVDDTTGDSMQQTTSGMDNIGAVPNGNASAANDMGAGTGMSAGSTTGIDNSQMSADNSSLQGDDMSVDTATGDDDY